MDKNNFKKALEKALAEKGSKKFTQTVDLIVQLKDIDLKKTEQQLDFFVNLPFSKGKDNKICGLVGPELVDEAKKNLDFFIEVHDFDKYKNNPKEIKSLADKYDLFVAQATIMPQVATVFGRVFGPRGKMPNPKAGCVVPPKAQLDSIKEKLKKTVRVTAKTSLSILLPIGNESQPIDELLENIGVVYNSLVSHTIQGENNIKSLSLKLTMGKIARVE